MGHWMRRGRKPRAYEPMHAVLYGRRNKHSIVSYRFFFERPQALMIYMCSVFEHLTAEGNMSNRYWCLRRGKPEDFFRHDSSTTLF
jgi:hypothetical protein